MLSDTYLKNGRVCMNPENGNPEQRDILPAGKLEHTFLSNLLHDLEQADSVILGPGIGRDVAVVDAGGAWLALKSDPITFATDEIGWYAVHVNANDLASAGAQPLWFLATLLLPEGGTDTDLVSRIMNDLTDACRSMGIALVGGHTEITVGLDKPIVAGTMIGSVDADSLVRSDGMQPGDDVLLTKGMAIETTAILAREASEYLTQSGIGENDIAVAADYLQNPGISVVQDSRIARENGDVHAMHDVTEGGVVTGLDELAEAAGIGIDVDIDALNMAITPLSREICVAVGIDPRGTISSGAMLMAVAPETTETIVAALAAEGIAAYRIGRAMGERTGCRFSGSDEPWPYFRRDEIARFFEESET